MASNDDFLAFVAMRDRMDVDGTPVLEVWSSSDGMAWESLGTPAFVTAGWYWSVAMATSDSYFAMAEHDQGTEIWFSQDARSWEPVSGVGGGFVDVELVGSHWVLWGDEVSSRIQVSTNGIDWASVDTREIGIQTHSGVAGGFGTSTAGNTIFFHQFDKLGLRNIWLLTLDT